MSSPGVPLALRERQRRETHLLLHRTAFDLAVENGVSAVSVQDISRVAGVSPRTFFNHFRSKDEALVADLPEFTEQERHAFLEGGEPDLVTALEVLLSAYLARMRTEAGVDEGVMAMKRLVEANPELLPRVLAVFGGFDQRLTALVAQRTGRRSDDLFCLVAGATAMATVRAGLAACHDPDAKTSRGTSPGTGPGASCASGPGAALGRSWAAGADAGASIDALVPAAFAQLRRLLAPPGDPDRQEPTPHP